VLFGDPAAGVPSADDWADAADTINYEIVTRIGHRVTRRYTSEGTTRGGYDPDGLDAPWDDAGRGTR
jgi:hypothetical protein